MLGEYVISSVLSLCNKDLKCWTSVTSWLQLRVLFGKEDSTPSRHDGRPTTKEMLQPILGPSFYTFVSAPQTPYPKPALCNLGHASKGACLLHLRFLLWSSDLSFIPFLWAFPFLCLLVTAILDSFLYSNYLIKGLYVFEKNEITVNANYLLQHLQVFVTQEVRWCI